MCEATVPSYRDMLLNLICHVTNNEKLKRFLKDDSYRASVELHHIDREYDSFRKYCVKYYKAKNNNHDNLALMPKHLHKLITKNRINLDDLTEEDGVFLLRNCIPSWFTDQIETATVH